jgi:hypothetical protein
LNFSCADISIASKDNDLILPLPTTTTTTQGPLFLFSFMDPDVFPSEVEQFPIFTYPSTTTTESTTIPTTTAMSFIFPFQPSEELINELSKNSKTFRCYPTNEVLKPLIGIENWCLQLCAVHCPPTLCACVHI